MPHDFHVKGWRTAQIGFEGESFFLLVPAAQQPLDGERARAEFHGDAGVFEAVRGKLQTGVHAGAVQPVRFEHASLAGAGRLHPAQGLRAPATVVGGKKEIPQPQSRNRRDHVNNKKAPHNASSDADGTSEVAVEASGQMAPNNVFFVDSAGGLWKRRIAPAKRLFIEFRRSPATMAWCPSSSAISSLVTSSSSGASTRNAFRRESPIPSRNSRSMYTTGGLLPLWPRTMHPTMPKTARLPGSSWPTQAP